MINIYAIPALEDNYIWVIKKDNSAIVVDPGEDKCVIDFLNKHQLNLSAILITHQHYDHIQGVERLQKIYPNTPIFTHINHHFQNNQTVNIVSDNQIIIINELKFLIYHTPGHTAQHLSFLLKDNHQIHVFCGDTLFSGGCGRVNSSIEELFNSIQRFNQLPENALFYPAHEYTCSNLKFALSICGYKNRQMIEQTLQKTQQDLALGKISLPTTLKKERQINVFLQTDDKETIENINQLYPLANHSPLEVFSTLRELKNNFRG